MKDFEAALFDVDGTLLDSLDVWTEVDRVFFAERGLILPEDYGASISGMSFLQTAQYTRERFHLSESTSRIMEIWREMCREAYEKRLELKPGAAQFVRMLKKQGKKLGIVTTLPEHLYRPALTRGGIYEAFDAFATTDESGESKACGRVYLLCARRLHTVPEACMVFEDIPEGIEGAHRAGMKACLVYDRHNAGFEINARRSEESITDYREAEAWT